MKVRAPRPSRAPVNASPTAPPVAPPVAPKKSTGLAVDAPRDVATAAASWEGRSGHALAPASSASPLALAAVATAEDLSQAHAAAKALSQAPDGALREVGRGAEKALRHVEKGAALELPLRAKLATARPDRLPQHLAGLLRDHDGKTTFYPTDEAISPFEVNPRDAGELPRDTLLLARATKRKERADGPLFYRLNGDKAPALRGRFTAVVDLVDGRPFARDLVKVPPSFSALPALDATTGKPWVEGTVLQARVEESTAELVVEARLAEGHTAEARSWIVAGGQRLEPGFPAAALEEAKRIASDLRLEDPALLDLTGEPFFAIDNHGSRDIDQAMRLERKKDGGYTLRYALADMSSYVKPGMALWDEAIHRGASFYIPGISVPMQPKEVCEHAVSLNAHELHRALVVTVELDRDGKVEKTSSALAKIKSRAQLTYPGVSEHLEKGAPISVDEHGQQVPREVIAQLKIFRDLGTTLREKARTRGVVETERREMRIGLAGENFFLHDTKTDLASKLNAELSILANCAGASLLAKTGIPGIEAPSIYRVHGAPGPEKLTALRRQLDAIVDANGAPPSWKWAGEETLARWVERLQQLPTTPRERSLSHALQGQVLGIQVSSEYAREPGLHSGLMVEGYGRFTAPMREAVGLVSHATLVQLESLRRVAAGFGDTHPGLVALWDHMLLGALVNPSELDTARREIAQEAVALAGLRGEAWKDKAASLLERVARAPATDAERKLVQDAVDRTLDAGNSARMKQRQAETASLKLLFDDLFLSDLRGVPEGDPNNPAPTRSGTVTMVSPGKLCVQLDDPDVEVRITRDDLKRGAGETFLLDNEGAELRCACAGLNERRLVVGQSIQVRATFHDGDKLHFTIVD